MNGVMCSLIAVSQLICSAAVHSRWTGDYGDALAVARTAHRPLLVILEKPDDPDGRLNQELVVATSPALLMDYQLCRLDSTTEYGSKVAESFGATTFPYTVITNASCRQIVFRNEGQFTPERWKTTLETYRVPSSEWPPGDQTAAVSPADTFVHADLATAQAAAKERERPLLVFVTMNGCHFCERMKAETFADSQVSEEIAAEYETVVVNQADDVEWVQRQSVRVFPTTLIFSPSGKRLERLDGFVAAGKLRQRLRSLAIRRLTAR